MSFIDTLTNRPTGFYVPIREPLMVATIETEMSHLNENSVEVWQSRLTLITEYCVPHRDALPQWHREAKLKLKDLVLRDYYEQAQRVAHSLYHLRQSGIEDGEALNDIQVRIDNLCNMLSPSN